MTALLVALGAAIGGAARYGVAEALATPDDRWPVATSVVNLSGSFLLGVLTGWLLVRSGDRLGGIIDRGPRPSREGERLRAFLGTGILGSFTTFSAFAVEVARLAEQRRVALGAAYLVTSIVAGLIAAHLGLRIGGRRSWV